jgi:hypothetical protein
LAPARKAAAGASWAVASSRQRGNRAPDRRRRQVATAHASDHLSGVFAGNARQAKIQDSVGRSTGADLRYHWRFHVTPYLVITLRRRSSVLRSGISRSSEWRTRHDSNVWRSIQLSYGCIDIQIVSEIKQGQSRNQTIEWADSEQPFALRISPFVLYGLLAVCFRCFRDLKSGFLASFRVLPRP